MLALNVHADPSDECLLPVLCEQALKEIQTPATASVGLSHRRPASLPPALGSSLTDINPRPFDPAAPKGGRLVQCILGTFDSLNPFIVRGIAPQSIRGYVVESLMARGYDEPFNGERATH
jgi:hypothetical protein